MLSFNVNECKPLAGGGMAGFSPLAAARARATASSQECAQLRDMLTELHGVVRRRGLAAGLTLVLVFSST
jgi:hypothetical protein